MVKLRKKEQIVTEALNKKADVSENEVKAYKVEREAAKEEMVTVFCGIPMGQILEMPNGQKVLLNGLPMSHVVSARKGEGFLPAGKYGETVLPKKQWEELLEKYRKYDFIINGVIFAKESVKEGRKEALEKSGGEKLDRNLGFDQADPKKGKTSKAETEE